MTLFAQESCVNHCDGATAPGQLASRFLVQPIADLAPRRLLADPSTVLVQPAFEFGRLGCGERLRFGTSSDLVPEVLQAQDLLGGTQFVEVGQSRFSRHPGSLDAAAPSNHRGGLGARSRSAS